MRILFLIYHGFSEHSGISKKIKYQIKGLRDYVYTKKRKSKIICSENRISYGILHDRNLLRQSFDIEINITLYPLAELKY